MAENLKEAFEKTKIAGSIAAGALDEVSKIIKPGISTNEMSYISPIWTYKLLTFLSVLMIIGELFAFLN